MPVVKFPKTARVRANVNDLKPISLSVLVRFGFVRCQAVHENGAHRIWGR
jgi:hypothetical protein